MKNIRLILSGLIICSVLSCKNSDFRNFDDFDYTTSYFPYQYPVRTLVLGDYVYDNKDDNNLKFKIAVRIGGLYTNDLNWKVDYQVDPSLVNKLATSPNLFDGKSSAKADTLKVLPAAYYTLSPTNKIDIPSGSFFGSVDVQLTEAFLNDPLAVKTTYVLPLKITSSTTDSVLLGKSAVDNADPRIAGNWITPPKNFTIFGIKYVNPFHGKYLHRGASVVTDSTTSILQESIVYRAKYVEQDEIWALQTISRYSVNVTGTLRRTPSSPGKFSMNLTFDSSNNCTVTTAPGSAFKVTGTGKFVTHGDKWGNIPQDAIYLDYVVRQGANKHVIKDTLVFRDKAVTFLEYSPVILP